jgi:serine/threonine protein kinase
LADFKTAIGALETGNIKFESLSKQIDILLSKTPHFANKMLVQLNESYENKDVNYKQYSQLKTQIYKFGPTETSETASDSAANNGAISGVATRGSIDKNITLSPEIHQPESDEDETVIVEHDKKASISNSQSTSSDINIPDGLNIDSSSTSATGPVGTKWDDPVIPTSDISDTYGEGSVIKQRFKLEKVLGIGGMGKVYKALDLLKAEAKDKKPYVAIKLLNDDFKDHPEAFISLQRESSRQQKLAHPNIATIYDFDRVGGPNTPVYITMELMEGMELKDYIKKTIRPRGGLPFDETYEIVKQLASGLIYAHERRLVHSDFKPGNCFMCDDGTVKTLDFGIARAVKNPVTGEAEQTLFDPGKLGALTPAYASLEMLEGEEPDTRDDTYALGCTTYELLTTKHPFNKLPANKAAENNLEAPYIKSLNKKQNRALRRSIAFHRKDRSPTVAHFLDEFEGKATWYKNPFVIAAGVLLIIGLMLIAPAFDYLHQKELENIIAEIEVGNEESIIVKLDEILLLDKADQSTITDDEEAKKKIQAYFSDKVSSLIDTSADAYDFPAAAKVIAEIEQFYPGSIFLQKETALVLTSKKQIISGLNAQYIAALKDPSLIDNTKNILDAIGKIEPGHSLLTDPRPSNAYRLLALDKFEVNEFDNALGLVESGLASAEGDPRLSDLKSKILRAQKVAQLEIELGAIQDQLSSLADFTVEQATIVELATLKPNSETITSLSESFKPIIETELTTINKSGTRQDAVTLAENFGVLLNSLQLNQLLTQVKLTKLDADQRKQKVSEFVNANIQNIEAALAEAQIDNSQWESNLLKEFLSLGSLVAEDENINTSLTQFRNEIVEIYTEKAYETLQSERFDAADGYIDIGERFAPELPEIFDARNAVANAREESDRRARIEANKNDFKTFTDGDNIVEAENLFKQLKTDLPGTDNFILNEGPQLLGVSLSRLAKRKAETKDFSDAYSFVIKGLEIDPSNVVLSALKNEYQAEANIIELSELFKTAVSFPVNIKLKISQIENASPARYAEFSKAAAITLADRINKLRFSDENASAGLAQNAAGLFPANAVLADLKSQLKLKPWTGIAAANASILAGKLTQAKNLQQAALTEFGANPEFVNFSQRLNAKIAEANSVYNLYLADKETAGQDYQKLRSLKNTLSNAQRLWTDSPIIGKDESDLDDLIAKYKPISKPRIRTVEKELTAESMANTGTGTGKTQARLWKPISSDSECSNRLAGYGKRAKAICFDMVHSSARGPLMVVVPNGEGIEKPFAISKYEASVSDWSKYCILSGTCKPIKNKERKNDPITGITLQEAQDYAKWLSERTGETYRIPTKSEWEYAANAGGNQPKKDFNCRVTVQEKLIKGTGIVSVKSGKSNGWGLKNYIGNVQEWVIDGNSTTARGGAFIDAHSKCDLSLERSHDGNADDSTGFRLIREDVG